MQVSTKRVIGFIPPMLLLKKESLPEGEDWLYEIKLDGYRAIAIKSGGNVRLRSRNDNDFTTRYRQISTALQSLPDETVIDGEVVALDEDGRPSFNLLQNFGSAGADLVYYVFDVLVLSGGDVRGEPLSKRRALLEKYILPRLHEPIRYSQELPASLPDLIEAVREQGFEGLVAKKRSSRYESGKRSGAWQKMRVNRSQDFVIGGYTVGGNPFDALVFGYYQGNQLMYAARTHAHVDGYSPCWLVSPDFWSRRRITISGIRGLWRCVKGAKQVTFEGSSRAMFKRCSRLCRSRKCSPKSNDNLNGLFYSSARSQQKDD
jgi:bifunctional non-homologous end joining protein LigD